MEPLADHVFADDVNITGERVRTIEKSPEALVDYLEDTGVDGSIIFRWIFRMWYVGH